MWSAGSGGGARACSSLQLVTLSDVFRITLTTHTRPRTSTSTPDCLTLTPAALSVSGGMYCMQGRESGTATVPRWTRGSGRFHRYRCQPCRSQNRRGSSRLNSNDGDEGEKHWHQHNMIKRMWNSVICARFLLVVLTCYHARQASGLTAVTVVAASNRVAAAPDQQQ